MKQGTQEPRKPGRWQVKIVKLPVDPADPWKDEKMIRIDEVKPSKLKRK